jgi:hypothetical protein
METCRRAHAGDETLIKKGKVKLHFAGLIYWLKLVSVTLTHKPSN